MRTLLSMGAAVAALVALGGVGLAQDKTPPAESTAGAAKMSDPSGKAKTEAPSAANTGGASSAGSGVTQGHALGPAHEPEGGKRQR